MLYKVKKEFMPYLVDELNFSYYNAVDPLYDFSNVSNERDCADDELLICTDCPESMFRRVYLRSICEKKSEDSDMRFVTAEESEDASMMELIFYNLDQKDYAILPESEYVPFEIIEYRPTLETRSTFQVHVDPDILLNEFHVRYYDAEIEETENGTFCTVRNCSDDVINAIVKRAKCMERTTNPILLVITQDEHDDQLSEYIFEYKYHTDGFLIEHEF